MHTYKIEITDTFGGEANYSWVKRETIAMPELTHYGYDGATNYAKANKTYNRELVKKAKYLEGWTGNRCRVEHWGDNIAIYPANACLVVFVTYAE